MADNDGPHSVQLRVCNEDGNCSESGQQQVQTYGELMPWHIQSITAEVDGTRVNWHVDVDTNGAPAQLVIEGSERPRQTFDLGGVDVQSRESGFLDLGYSATEDIKVTLVDPSARNRGPVVKRDVVSTPPEPPAEVKVRRGTSCSDDAGSPLPRCNTDGQGADCVDASCGFIELVVSEFHSPVTCVVTSQGGDIDATIGPIPDDATTETRLYFGTPGNWIRAQCSDDTGDRTARDLYDWPN